MTITCDITGQRYSRLVAIKRVPPALIGKVRWLFRCDCGATVEVNKNDIVSGHTRSCGCLGRQVLRERNLSKKTHRLSNTRIYHTWRGMKRRCYDEKIKEYKYYGARGIKVCDSWMDFEHFYEWSKTSGYTDLLTIDRINNEFGYSPENCKWSTIAEQNRNKRTSRFILFQGKSMILPEWSRRLNIPQQTIRGRIKRGCSIPECLNSDYQRNAHAKRSI